MLDIYAVKSSNKIQEYPYAFLEEAKKDDLIILNQKGFKCDWIRFWSNSDFDCEAIVKLNYQGNILGLIYFGVYPYPFPNNSPEYLEILNIECIPETGRTFNPVGFWLIWYAVTIGIKTCKGKPDGTLIMLDSLEDAIPYYQDKVMMEGIGWTTIAPKEDGYAFRFTKKQAEQFCTRIQKKYGLPTLIP